MDPVARIRAKVHVDNNDAISFAHRMGASARTKCIHTKHWFFKEHVGEGSSIDVVRIDSEDNLADLFTKGVEEHLFVPLRDKLMGWFMQQ